MKIRGALVAALLPAGFLFAQTGYDIRIDYSGCPDSTVYLARYYWDQYPIEDSCKNVRNGKIRFSGDQPLDPGVYFLASQQRDKFYFQFIVDRNQKFTVTADHADAVGTSKSNDKQNQEFFSYVKFMTEKNNELHRYAEDFKGRPDSAKKVSARAEEVGKLTTRFDADFMKRNKGSFVADLMNMKAEKYATDVPLASNGRPDSVYQYYYYVNHYFDGINFKDQRILSTPFFAGKVKKYFDQLVPQIPDSVIIHVDRVLGRCEPKTKVYTTLVGHLAYKYEQHKGMIFDQQGRAHSFEKVFVHLADHYIAGGKMEGFYDEETEKKIVERANIVRNLLPDAQVPDLFVIDTLHGREVLGMGFDTVKTSEGATKLYEANLPRLRQLFKRLYEVPSRYTVLVFWAADCDHCKKEVPKLHEELKKLEGKTDVSVFAVQTKFELFDQWKKFIVEKQLTGFTHVFDPVHINNLREQFDIQATPVIYLLDRDKKIKAKKISPDQVVEIIGNLEKIENSARK